MKINITVNAGYEKELEFEFDYADVYAYAEQLAADTFKLDVKNLSMFASELDIYDKLLEYFEDEIKDHFEELAWEQYRDWQ